MFFPEIFGDSGTKEFYGNLKTRTGFVLDEILGGEKSKEIEQIDLYLFNLAKPHEFSGRKGIEIKYIKSFEQMCVIMSQNLSVNPKTMIVLEYYQAWSVLKKQFKKK